MFYTEMYGVRFYAVTWHTGAMYYTRIDAHGGVCYVYT